MSIFVAVSLIMFVLFLLFAVAVLLAMVLMTLMIATGNEWYEPPVFVPSEYLNESWLASFATVLLIFGHIK